MTNKDYLRDAFLRYTKISSQSVRHGEGLPTSEGQQQMVMHLKNELHDMGVTDADLHSNGILIAKIQGNTDAPAISFMSHVDTVDIGASPDVHAHIVEFTGDDFYLDKEQKIQFKVDDYPSIKAHKGDEIFVTDGSSVLGSDDKAGVAVMMGLARYLTTNNVKHGDVYLAFVPDEEIGLKGAKALDIRELPVKFSYTIDCSDGVGSFSYETFNAAEANITIKGVSIHPGRAYHILVNPVLVANDIIESFSDKDTPEYTKGYEGYYYFYSIEANPMEAKLNLNIRDFDLKKFEKRKEHVLDIIAKIQKKHPKAEITVDMYDVYANIANYLSQDKKPIELVEKSLANLGIEIQRAPLRGGTDGSVLSAKGLMTPNIFTGGYNVHSIFEYLPLAALEKSLDNTIEMVRILGEGELK